MYWARDAYVRPDPTDKIYQLELACIDVARRETLRCKGPLVPTFAAEGSFFDRLVGRSYLEYVEFPVPKLRSIDQLWDRYRPTPWACADNRGVLSLWIKILYDLNESRRIEVNSILDAAFDPDQGPPVEWSFEDPLITRQERWRYISRCLGKMLPLYG